MLERGADGVTRSPPSTTRPARRLLLVRRGLELDAERREQARERAVDGIEELAPGLDREPRDVRRRDPPADARARLEHVDVDAVRGQIDRCGQPGDAAADHEDVVRSSRHAQSPTQASRRCGRGRALRADPRSRRSRACCCVRAAIHESTFAALGALAMLVTTCEPLTDAWHVLRANLGVLAFLAGVLALAAAADDAGWFADGRAAGGARLARVAGAALRRASASSRSPGRCCSRSTRRRSR